MGALTLALKQAELERRIAALETMEAPIRVRSSEANVSSPPTDAEIDAAFGTPAQVGDGFVGLIDDAGAGTTLWLVVARNGHWWYEELTAAV